MTDKKKEGEGENKPALVAILGGNTPDNNADTIRKLEANIPNYVRYQTLVCQMIRIKYLALLEAGFDTEQALHLCKKDE